MTGVARQDSGGGPFVELDGRRFESPELDAPEGTDVDVEPYMGIGDGGPRRRAVSSRPACGS